MKETNWREITILRTRTQKPNQTLYKSSLAKKMEIIADLNETILTQIEDEDIETETGEASEFMDEIDICLTTLEDATRVETEEQVPSTQGILAQQLSTSTTHEVSNCRVRLSKSHLPSFDGKFMECSTFWDSFQSAVH